MSELPRKLPVHVAVIMDGNGRWAQKRGLPRFQGHFKGAESVKEIVKATREFNIPWLTLYSFSEENWKRSKEEIETLMNLLVEYLEKELPEMQENGIRLKAIGRIWKLPEKAREKLLEVMEKTSNNKDMTLVLALSYGGRQEIIDMLKSVLRIKHTLPDLDKITESFIAHHLYLDMPDPDLLIRTGGEKRISNFLLWQIAYTELYFTDVLWPDFGREEYIRALQDFARRKRRFGGV